MCAGPACDEQSDLDYKQDDATKELIDLHPADKNFGKWPTEFDNKSIELTEQKSNDIWDVDLKVKTLKRMQ